MENYVLIAEDNLTDQLVIKSLFEDKGFVVICAKNGFEAVELLDQFDFKLFVIDLQMPFLSGLQLLKRIRARPEISSVPAIVLSGRKKETDILTAMKCGASDYILKPINQEVFDDKILPILANSKESPTDFHLASTDFSSLAEAKYKLNIRSLNPRCVHFQSTQFFDKDEILTLEWELFSKFGLNGVTIKIIDCTKDDGLLSYSVTGEYQSFSKDDMVKMKKLLTQCWAGKVGNKVS